MKHIASRTGVPGLAVGAGCAGLVLRRLMYLFAVDEKGLLVTGHPMCVALWLLTAAAVAVFAMSVRKLQEEPADGYTPEGTWAAGGHAAAALGIGLTLATKQPPMSGGLGQVWLLLGMAATVGLAWAAAELARGKKPLFLLHLIPCLFLLVHTVNHYQMWSSEPQLTEYGFMLFATVALMLFAFYTARLEVGLGGGRLQRFMGLAAVYLLLTELAAGMYPGLYLGGIVWAATGLWAPKPKTEEKKAM